MLPLQICNLQKETETAEDENGSNISVSPATQSHLHGWLRHMRQHTIWCNIVWGHVRDEDSVWQPVSSADRNTAADGLSEYQSA